jgi:hypothetical protein
MANPAKRKVTDTSSDGTDGTEDSDSTGGAAAAGSDGAVAGGTAKAAGGAPKAATGSAAAKPAKVVPPKAKARAKASPQATPARHTPPKPAGKRAGPSPRWVPVLMFALWGLGLLLIVLNYMGVLPGASDGGNGWYLVAGLVSILSGIMVATQYR